MRIEANKNTNKVLRPKYERKEVITCYLMLSLAIIGFFVFTLYPMFWAAKTSFYTYDGIASHTKFVGWDNFKTLFRDAGYWKSWLVNIGLFIVKAPIEMLLAFITAYILTSKVKGAGIFRTIYYLPAIISGAIVALIFSNLFDFFGVINANLVRFGIISESINWFANTSTAFVVIVFATFWMSFGTNVLYMIAALSNVSDDVKESARLDGANEAAIMFKIILPMILPMLSVVLLLSINGILTLGELVLLLTGGAPAGTTFTVQAYLMRYTVPGFGGVADLGYMSSAAIITSIIACIVGAAVNKCSNKLENVY